MKKIVSLVLIFVFSISLAIVQTANVTAQDAPSSEDPASIQTLEEAQQALADAKAKLSTAGFLQKFKILQQIKRLEGRLMDLIVDGEGAKPTKCASLVDQSIAKTDKSIQEITNKICGTTEQRVDITFYPMLEHCKSPFDLKCVCGHHPDRPGCGGSSMSGGNMSGEGMAGGDNAMANNCLSAEEAQAAIADLQRARENLVKIQELDADINNVPDLCEKQN